MIRLREDLWHTTPKTEGNTLASYLLLRPAGNVLFYNAVSEADLEPMAALGGVSHHVLSHRHETGQSPLALVHDRFSPKLYADATEAAAFEGDIRVDVAFERPADAIGDIEVLYTPGHTEGGVSCLYHSPQGETYLFSGDNMVPVQGTWIATIVAAHGGDVITLAASIAGLRALAPNLVLASTCIGDVATEVDPRQWAEIIDVNIRRLTRKRDNA